MTPLRLELEEILETLLSEQHVEKYDPPQDVKDFMFPAPEGHKVVTTKESAVKEAISSLESLIEKREKQRMIEWLTQFKNLNWRSMTMTGLEKNVDDAIAELGGDTPDE